MTKKALLLTYHNWNSRRWGGMHSIGEALSEDGWTVLFWSLSRPFWGILFSRDERLRWKSVKPLIRPEQGKTKKPGLANLAILSGEILGERRIPGVARLNSWARERVWEKFVRYAEMEGFIPQLIVLESCEGLYFFEHLKKIFPDAKIIYRVSDPIFGWGNPRPLMIAAEKQALAESDLVLFVNRKGCDAYLSKYGSLNNQYNIVMNGFDLESFQIPKPRPKEFPFCGPVYSYVGGHEPQWDAILALSKKIGVGKIIIVCPVKPRWLVKKELKLRKNIIFIQGIFPSEVAGYLMHSDVIIIPYPERMKMTTMDLHSKILQAMASKKPIVCLNVEQRLNEYGIYVAKNIKEFVEMCINASKDKNPCYSLDLHPFSWVNFKKIILNKIHILCGKG